MSGSARGRWLTLVDDGSTYFTIGRRRDVTVTALFLRLVPGTCTRPAPQSIHGESPTDRTAFTEAPRCPYDVTTRR